MCIRLKAWMRWGIRLLVAVCVSTSMAEAAMRYWHEKNGNEFLGDFEKELFGKYYFRGEDSRLFKVPVQNLIEADVRYIDSMNITGVEIKYTRTLHTVTDYPVEYETDDNDDVEIEVTARVEISNEGKEPYMGILRGELYLVGDEMATDLFQLFAKKQFNISFKDCPDGVFTASVQKGLRTWDDGEKTRGTQYLGYLVMVETPGGNILGFETNLRWMTREKLEALRSLPCPCFLNEECEKQSVPRPTAEREINPLNY